MSKETKIVREAPTVYYKMTKVTGGRSPKTETTIKIGGDVDKVASDLAKNKTKPLLAALREAIKTELNSWEDEDK